MKCPMGTNVFAWTGKFMLCEPSFLPIVRKWIYFQN